ncbi:putative Xaa-Pro aminopeptidase P [Flagelloscypha sp. PMI_526]|nr:putative Xaa-Pro aminopeptidase P [Flagelloscypha sp. PMI_526]
MIGEKVNTTARLAALRESMQQHSVQAFVIPSEDQHFSEYIAACDERRAFISGFNGSAGLAVVTLNDAFLFTDGRYFLQAEQQLDSNWTLMKQGLPDVPTWNDFLNLDKSTKIGIDPALISASDAKGLKEGLAPLGSSLVPLSNLVDPIWSTERPSRPKNPIFHLPTSASGESHTSKIDRLLKVVETQKATSTVVTALDEVAWLFNLRGSDIDYNPVFFAYAVIRKGEKPLLFVQDGALEDQARKELGDDVDVKSYDDIWGVLKELDGKVLLSDKASLAVAEAIGKEDKYILARSPVADLKTIKNDTELAGFRDCHVRDGVALVKYFAWLEETLVKGDKVINETEAADVLEKYRSEQAKYKGLSFPTISGAGSNAAIIHYQPPAVDSAMIKRDEIYLCDSGAQFLDGTTDVTRTYHFGEPTQEQKNNFTRVLQGHIEIDTAVFPNGTTGFIIDTWARKYLWQDGLDYRHGTGHGVGHFLNVHEGPQGIGVRISTNATPLKVGMTVSNEPGYYEDGKYGIRIENIVLVVKKELKNDFGSKGWLGFEHVTLCPMGLNLIEATLLDAKQKAWVNGYHRECLGKLGPLLKDDERALKWLEKECQQI